MECGGKAAAFPPKVAGLRSEERAAALPPHSIRAFLALGSNVGDRRGTLRRAMAMLGRVPGVRVRAVSGFHETAPVGGPAGQGPYLNAAAELETTLSPRELLAALQEIERALGRDRAREARWGPRTCDLDILLMGETVLNTEELTIPHPRMHERRFVLCPLAEIAPSAVHPVLRKTVAELLGALEEHE
jgi:2-amino-4-hydroxy-6-hydroxymethyldihydropteridine diphosphokinase